MEEGFPSRKWKRNGVLHMFVYIQKHNRGRRRRTEEEKEDEKQDEKEKEDPTYTHTLPSISMMWECACYACMHTRR